jgi:hypothetical protein
VLIITTLTNAILFIQNPEMMRAWSSQFVSPSNLIMIWSIPLFFDAFNEEFLFRGIFFFFAYKNTENLPLAYIVSMMVAFAWHPEFTLFRIIPIFVQGTLLCYTQHRHKLRFLLAESNRYHLQTRTQVLLHYDLGGLKKLNLWRCEVYLLYKSKNIHGAWISHGINRTSGSVVAQLLME